MKRSFWSTLALCLGLVVGLTLVPGVSAKTAKAAKVKKGKITGTVHMINKDTSTLTVSKGSVQRPVGYTADTKWIYGTQGSNKPATFDQLKEGWYINCDGTFEGTKLMASACRFREAK
ncbi:MAG: hypothetical protein DMG57_02020 [Acidobacteria bacterium]|nr:MAG: hypothetical protein DMG57_02020 [Acidobacteriota bacterium]